jgi:hypothetical protein
MISTSFLLVSSFSRSSRGLLKFIPHVTRVPVRLLANEVPKPESTQAEPEEKKGFFGRMKESVTNTFKEAQFKQFIKTFEKEMDFEGKIIFMIFFC